MKKKHIKWRKITFSLAAALAGLAMFFLLMEMVLAAGVFDGRNAPDPAYIPRKFQDINFAINRDNHLTAKKNPHYFNDIPRNIEKPEKILRIAVLGDSFIWGDGTPYDTVWSHKLERIISSAYENIEVLSWGQIGWNTEDEMHFLITRGILYRPDVVVVGCTADDLSGGPVPELHFFFEGGTTEKLIKSFFPRTTDFITCFLKRFYEVNIDKSFHHAKALSAKYTPENLDRFARTVKAMKRFCDENGIGLVFVMTPDAPSAENREYLGKLGEVFLNSALTCLDLFPAVDAKFADTNPRTLWANPANRHPGDLLTQLFADEAFRFLKKGNFLAGAKRGERPYINGSEALVKSMPSDIRTLDFFGKTGKTGSSLLLTQDLTAAAQSRGVSGVHLFENGSDLTRVFDPLQAANGAGLFCISGSNLVFSATDGSDPLVNGRAYSLSFPEKRLSFYIHIRDKAENLLIDSGQLKYESAGPALRQKADSPKNDVADPPRPKSALRA